MRGRLSLLCALAVGGCLTGCLDGAPPEGDGDGDGTAMPFSPPSETGPSEVLEPGGTARVTADFLNLRDAVGTSANILVAMPCSAQVNVVEGPSQQPVTGWWHVQFTDDMNKQWDGWASGKYLISSSQFSADVCGASTTGDMGAPSTMAQAIFNRAKSGVGYSYYWGHGSWNTDGSSLGTCSGDCPSCDHTGSFGADCSGYVAKVWQVPSASALTVDEHPYSTLEFYNDQTYWTQIDRTNIAPADALVRRSGSSGHIVLFESGSDPMGALSIYEAQGCATGVIHDMRTIDSSYRAIRRDGL